MFLDSLPSFNFNNGGGNYISNEGQQISTDTSKLGSTLMATMLEEIESFCKPFATTNSNTKPHNQVILYHKTFFISLQDVLFIFIANI